MHTPCIALSDCPDVLRISQLCAVLRISESEYYRLKAHGAFPIAPLPSLGGAVRYSKTAVQRYLDGAPVKLRRVG